MLTVYITAPNSRKPFDATLVIKNPKIDYPDQLAYTKMPLGTLWFQDLTFDLCWLTDNSRPDIYPTFYILLSLVGYGIMLDPLL